MGNVHKLSDYRLSDIVNMKENDFNECFKKLDRDAFMKNPTKALKDTGVLLKPGITLKIIENETEISSLSPNVFPILINKQLSMGDLDKVSGGGLGLGGVLTAAWNFIWK